MFISHPEVIDFETHFTEYECTLRVKNLQCRPSSPGVASYPGTYRQFRNKDELALEDPGRTHTHILFQTRVGGVTRTCAHKSAVSQTEFYFDHCNLKSDVIFGCVVKKSAL